MLFSIIIPLYNKRNTISKTLNSVSTQSYKDWETIIIDDGSTDGSFSEVENYVDNDRIKYFSKKNGGVSSARNFGVPKASGEYLLFLDADDTVDNKWLSSFALSVQETQPDIIFCGCNVKRGDNVRVVLPGRLGKMHKEINGLFLAGTFCVRRELFELVGGYDERLKFSENYELGMRLLEEGAKVADIQKALIDYNDGSNDKTSNSLDNRLHANLLILEKYKNVYKKDIPYFAGLLSMTGYLLKRKNHKKQARKLFWQCLRMRPFYTKNLYRLATAYIK